LEIGGGGTGIGGEESRERGGVRGVVGGKKKIKG